MNRFFGLLLLFLAGCSAAPLPSPPQPPTPVIWQAQLTPAMGWLKPTLTACMKEQPQANLILLERPAPLQDAAAADVTLRWGAPASLALPANLLGGDELVFVVHPSNPVNQLKLEELRAILSGKTTAWSQINAGAVKETLQAYTYGEGEDIQSILEWILPGLPVNRETAWLAPDPLAVRQSVASLPAAFGYLPKRWLDSSVKSVSISDLPAANLRHPLLALSRVQPEGGQKAFLQCLVDSIR